MGRRSHKQASKHAPKRGRKSQSNQDRLISCPLFLVSCCVCLLSTGHEAIVALAHPCTSVYQSSSSHLHRTNPIAPSNPKKESRPTRVRRGHSNNGNQPHHTHTHTTKNKRGRNRRSNSTASTPFIVVLLFSCLLILPCPSRATTIASTLPTQSHTTTATVIQSLTSVSAGPTKISPSTLQANRTETCTQPAANAQHGSDLLRIPRRHKHCDKQSTVRYGFNGRAGQSG